MFNTPQNAARIPLFGAAICSLAIGLQAQYLTGQQMTFEHISSTGNVDRRTFKVDSTPGAVELGSIVSDSLSCDVFDIASSHAQIVLQCSRTLGSYKAGTALVFTFPGLPSPAFKNVQLLEPEKWPGAATDRLTVTSESIRLDIGGLRLDPDYYIRLQLNNPGFTIPLLSVRTSHVELCWNATVTRTYQLQYKEGLITGNWIDLGDPITADRDPMCINQPIVAAPRFYRIVGLP